MIAASMSNASDYHHLRQYLPFSCETISREMAAINVYSVLYTGERRRRFTQATGQLVPLRFAPL